jgi:tight adherence protein B
MPAPDAYWVLPISAFLAFGLAFWIGSRVFRNVVDRFTRQFTHWVDRELNHSFLFVNPRRVLWLYLVSVCGLVLFVLLVFRHFLPAVLAASLMAVVPRLVMDFRRRRRLQRYREQMPDLIALVAGGMRAGASLNGALSEVARQLPAPAGQEIALVLRQSRLGTTLDEAIGALEQRMPAEESVLLVSALRIGAQSGGSMAQTLESLADAVRRRLVLEKKIRALTAQGRMQAWIMGVLPFLVLLAMFAIDPHLVAIYFGTVIGWVVLGIVLVLQLSGGWMIRRIVRIEI